MTDEPTPPQVEAGDVAWIGEPPPVRVRPRPRNPIGWIVSSLIIVFLAAGAVGAYTDEDEEASGSEYALQTSLKQSLSWDAGGLSFLKSEMEKQRREGLEEVFRDANDRSVESEEAARIAVVTARELGKDAPRSALGTLRRGADPESRAMVPLYDGRPATEEALAGLESVETDEFATQLAIVQARERLGLESGRSEIVPSDFLLRSFVVGAVSLVFLVGGVIALISFSAMRASGRLVPQGIPGFEKADGDRYVLRFAVYLLLFVGASAVAGGLLAFQGFEDLNVSWLMCAVQVAVLAALVMTLYVPMGDRPDTPGSVIGERRPFWRLVGAGLYGYLCTVPLIVVSVLVMLAVSQLLPEPTHPINEEIASAGALDWLAIALSAVVLAPLLEELAFRGLLFPALVTQIRKPWVAMAVCGLAFAAIHPQGPLLWPTLAMTGATAAALRYYTGSIIPSIVLHMAHNGYIVVFSYVMG